MKTTTVRLPENELRLLRAIAGYEGKSLSEIFKFFTEEYILRHRETMELLNIPNFYEECIKGMREIKKGGGKNLDEMEN